jgi:hypothetical protein
VTAASRRVVLRLLWVTSVGVFSTQGGVHVARAADPCPPPGSPSGDGVRSRYVPCPERCSQNEACVAGRCVFSCEVECREGTYCSELGGCVPLPRPLGPVRTEATLHEEFGARSKKYRKVVTMDLAGILFDGVQVSYEWGQARSWQIGVRPLSTGFWNYTSLPRNEFEAFDYGGSLSLVHRIYETGFGNLRGMYYGLGVEAAAFHVVDSGAYVERFSVDVTPIGQFGYRWAWNSFVFGFGPVLGLRVPVYSYRYGTGLGSCPVERCSGNGDVSLRGYLSVEVGFFP